MQDKLCVHGHNSTNPGCSKPWRFPAQNPTGSLLLDFGVAPPGLTQGYSRVAEEEEVEEGVGPEEVDDGATQTPARARQDGKASDHQEDGAWQGDFATLGSLWDTAGSWAFPLLPGENSVCFHVKLIYGKSICKNDLRKKTGKWFMSNPSYEGSASDKMTSGQGGFLWNLGSPKPLESGLYSSGNEESL